MSNPIIQTYIADILGKLDQKLDKIDERLNKLEFGQAEIKGEIKTLDTKVEQLDKRIANQEFLNRGIFGGIALIVLGGAAKLFGWMPNG